MLGTSKQEQLSPSSKKKRTAQRKILAKNFSEIFPLLAALNVAVIRATTDAANGQKNNRPLRQSIFRLCKQQGSSDTTAAIVAIMVTFASHKRTSSTIWQLVVSWLPARLNFCHFMTDKLCCTKSVALIRATKNSCNRGYLQSAIPKWKYIHYLKH